MTDVRLLDHVINIKTKINFISTPRGSSKSLLQQAFYSQIIDGSIDSTRFFPSVKPKPEGVPYTHCKEYKCGFIGYNRKMDNYICKKNGGKLIGSIHEDKCKYGTIYKALKILCDEPKVIGIDPASSMDGWSDAIRGANVHGRSYTVISNDIQDTVSYASILGAAKLLDEQPIPTQGRVIGTPPLTEYKTHYDTILKPINRNPFTRSDSS